MKSILIEELERINTLMGNKNINFNRIEESLNKKIILSEQGAGFIERLLQLAKNNFKNKEELLEVLEYLDKAGKESVELPKLDKAGKPLSRLEQLEILAAKLSDEAETIALKWEKEMTFEESMQKLNDMLKAAVKGEKAIRLDDPELLALLSKLENASFEKDEDLLKFYEDTRNEIKEWIKNQPVGEVKTQEDILGEFERVLKEKLEKALEENKSPYKITDDVYKRLIEYYKNKFKTKPSPSKTSPIEDIVTETGRQDVYLPPSETRMNPKTVDVYGLSVNFFEVKALWQKFLDTITSLRKGQGFNSSAITAERIQTRLKILEQLPAAQIINEAGELSEDVQKLIRAHVRDLKILKDMETNFILRWNEFLGEMDKFPGWKPVVEKLKDVPLYEKNGKFGIGFIDQSIGKYMEEVSKVLLSNPNVTKTGKITGAEVGSFKQIWRQITFRFRELFTEVKVSYEAAGTTEKTFIKKGAGAAKSIIMQKIWSLLTFYTLFTPRQIMFVMQVRGVSAKAILTGYFATYVMMVVWKKFVKSLCLGVEYFVLAMVGFYETDVKSDYYDLFFKELEEVWGVSFDRADEKLQIDLEEVKRQKGFKGLGKETGLNWYLPIDIKGGVWRSLITILNNTMKKSTQDADDWINTTYQENTKKLWGQLDEEDKVATFEVLSKDILNDFGYFLSTTANSKSTRYGQVLQANKISEAELEKIKKAKIGKIPMAGTTVESEFNNLVKEYLNSDTGLVEDKKAKLVKTIKDGIKFGAFISKSGKLYEIYRDNLGTLNKVFMFRPLTFYPFFDLGKIKMPGSEGYRIYFEDKIDKKPIQQEKKDIEKSGIDLTGYKVDQYGTFEKEKEAKEIKNKLQSLLPKVEPSKVSYNMKQFASELDK